MARKYSTNNKRKGRHKKETPVVLTCIQHTLWFIEPAPKLGDILWCKRCGAYLPVIGVGDGYDEYRSTDTNNIQLSFELDNSHDLG